ncbi:ComEA family DNA-binding protein [Elusimicrobiota bacterium]
MKITDKKTGEKMLNLSEKEKKEYSSQRENTVKAGYKKPTGLRGLNSSMVAGSYFKEVINSIEVNGLREVVSLFIKDVKDKKRFKEDRRMKRLIKVGAILLGIAIIAVPMVSATKTEGLYTRAEALDDLNTLSASALDALPISGLGAVMAGNIVAERPFVVIEDLDNVSGISVPGATYDNIRTYFWGSDMIPNDEGGPVGNVDQTGSVDISATVAGVTALTVDDESGDGAIDFGTISNLYQAATEHIAVDAVSNYGSWAIELYTDNFPSITPDVDDWGYAYGGMIDVSQNSKIALGWCAFDEVSPGETPDDPAASVVIGTETFSANRWTYVKDKGDVDDPAASGDQSFAGRGGYCNVAYGGPGYAYVVNPNDHGDGTDPMGDTDVYVYIETASTAVPGTYTSAIYFDLYHQ